MGEPEALKSRRLRELLPRGELLRDNGERPRRPGFATAELSIAEENRAGIEPLEGDFRVRGGMQIDESGAGGMPGSSQDMKLRGVVVKMRFKRID